MDSNSTTKLLAGPKKTHSYFPSLCECVKRGYTECYTIHLVCRWKVTPYWYVLRKSTSAILYWVWKPRTSLHLFNFLQHNVHQHTGQRLSKAESFGTSWNLYPIEMFRSFTTFWCQARGRFYNKLHILSTVFFLKVFLFLSTPFWIALMYDDVIYHLFSKIVWLVYFWDSYLQDWNSQEWNVDRFNQYCWMTFIFNNSI